MVETTNGNGALVFIPGKPVAASRPRVTKRGITYYPKSYREWKKHAKENMEINDPSGILPLEGQVYCEAFFVWPLPAKTHRQYPRGDVDNLQKALFDAITDQGNIWTDDDQLVRVHAVKRYGRAGEPGYIMATLRNLPSNEG